MKMHASGRRVKRQPKSVVFYRGPSLLDGAPIVGIVTGLKDGWTERTHNPKTEGLVQTWILRADVAPHDALHSGDDYSVCGDCKMRPFTAKGTGQPLCYATCSGGRFGIVNIWRSFRNCGVPDYAPEEAATLLRGRQVRLGAYGDPAAIPMAVWEALLSQCGGSIGYTHQWRTCAPDWARLVMASVETLAQREEAKQRGYRTFRVRSEAEARLRGEVTCPASVEAGKKLTCAECRACCGTASGRRGDVVILAHGAGWKR